MCPSVIFGVVTRLHNCFHCHNSRALSSPRKGTLCPLTASPFSQSLGAGGRWSALFLRPRLWRHTESQNGRLLAFGFLNFASCPGGSSLLFSLWVRTTFPGCILFRWVSVLHCASAFGCGWVQGAAVVPVLWFYPKWWAPQWEIVHLCSPALIPVPGEFSVSAH